MTKPHRVVPTLTEVLDEAMLVPVAAKASDVFLDLDLEDLGGEEGSPAVNGPQAALSSTAELLVSQGEQSIELDLSSNYALELMPEDLSAGLPVDLALDLEHGRSQDLAQGLAHAVAQQLQAVSTPDLTSQLKPQCTPAVQVMIETAVDEVLADLRESLLTRVEALVSQVMAEQQALEARPEQTDSPWGSAPQLNG